MTHFIVVQDADGVVGAFSSVARAVELLAPYSQTPLVFTKWEGEGDEVWVLPYDGVHATAFASTSRDAVVAAQNTMKVVGLVCADSVDYWKCKMDCLIEPALKRLEGVVATMKNAGACGEKVSKELGEDDPNAQFLKMLAKGSELAPFDETRINILEGVVCRELPAADVKTEPASTRPAPGTGATETAGSSARTE